MIRKSVKGEKMDERQDMRISRSLRSGRILEEFKTGTSE
jgi:hypothetical protein